MTACGRTLLEPVGTFSSPQMAWKLNNQFSSSSNYSTLSNSIHHSSSLFAYPSGLDQPMQLGNALSVAHLLPDDNEHMYHPYHLIPNENVDGGAIDHSLIGMVNEQTFNSKQQLHNSNLLRFKLNQAESMINLDSLVKSLNDKRQISSAMHYNLNNYHNSQQHNQQKNDYLKSSSALGFTSASPILCQWRINAASGERIQLNFTHMDITGPMAQESINSFLNTDNLNNLHRAYELTNRKITNRLSCVNDYIEIRDGYFSGSLLIGK